MEKLDRDDNKAVADTLRMLVAMMGNDVRTASDGEEAIEIAATFAPEIILMDLGMPAKKAMRRLDIFGNSLGARK